MNIWHHTPMKFFVIYTLTMFLLAGCSGQKPRYVDDTLRETNAVLYGRVLNVGEIKIKEDPALLNPLAGGIIGGSAGVIIGELLDISSAATGAFTIGGATLGLTMAGFNDSPANTYTATELTVELENSNVLVIVLSNDEYFVRGDEVRIVSLGEEKVRVQHR